MLKHIAKLFGCAIVCAVAVFTSVPAYAAGEGPKTVTYAEAVKMATNKLSSILSLEDSIKALRDQKSSVSGSTASSIDKQIESLKLNQTILKSSVEMSLMNALVTINGYEMDIRLMQETIRLNEENVRRVGLKRQYGMASDNDLRAAEQTLTQNRSNLDTLHISLASEKQSLNKILQVPLTQDITVTYTRELVGLPENLESYIAAKVKSDPGIKQKQLNVDIKKTDMNDNNNPSQNITLENEYDKAVRERDDAKKSLEAAIRTNYNNLEQLIKQNASLQVDLEKSKDNLKTAQAHLKVGMATQYDVDSAALAILNNEVSIEKNLNKFWTLYFGFTYPYLLS